TRRISDDLAADETFRAMAARYDRIVLVEAAAAEQFRPDAFPNVRVCGTVLSREADDLLDRDAARRALGVPLDARCLYVSTGGGGYKQAPKQLELMCRTLRAM